MDKIRIIFIDLLQKLLGALLIVYLVLFSLETLKKGLIMQIINLNVLLLVIFLLLVSLLFFDYDKEKIDFIKKKSVIKIISWAFFLFLVLFLTIVLFEASLLETIVYIITVFGCGVLFFSLITKDEKCC